MNKCISGKRVYASQEIAEDVLIEAWTKFDYRGNNGPVSVYQCEDCGRYHLTSKGPMNEKLARALADGKVRQQQEANRWLDKLKGR